VHIGVIGSGIAGLGAAWLLSGTHEVDVIEGGDHLGGHAHTVDVRVDGQDIAVDTGFMVFNERTYPNLVGMFETLGVTSQKTTMSFGVQCGEEDLEWSSRNLVGVFAQPENALRGGLWRMVYDIARLSASADTLLADTSTADLTLGELLEREGYGGSFVEWYLVPMAAAIWSAPPGKIMDFPAQAFLQFCENHGLLHITGKPTWRTVVHGSRSYVERLTEGISGEVSVGLPATRVSRPADGPLVELGDGSTRRYDAVVLACHSDEALALLADPTPEEQAILGAVTYLPNHVVLHTDESFLPRRKLARAAWNYYATECTLDAAGLSVTYDLTRLQNLPVKTPVLVTVNPLHEPQSDQVLRTFSYAHPVFTRESMNAQLRVPEIQGTRGTWYCGAWQRYGFHEDGLLSAVRMVEHFGIRPPWAGQAEPAASPAPTQGLRSGAGRPGLAGAGAGLD
jgi:predicted NAD/FAD-binding protein